MKVSRSWLQKFFATDLPSAEALTDALTFHVFEIEEVEAHGVDTILDVKVLPDRAAYGLSHRGVAYELSAILDMPMQIDPLRAPLPEYPVTETLKIQIENPEKCLRYMAIHMRGVKVGPSPAWLKEALESVGQRSINNVVDATNFVMLNIGQPLHAFDANNLSQKDGAYMIKVRGSRAEEKITTLTGEEYVLPEGMLLIADGNTDAAIGIAGVKGGIAAAITESTMDIILEAANFDGTSLRRASQALKLWTDASLRFQNRPSPELAAYGMRDIVALVQEVAGGEVVGGLDVYPAKDITKNSSVSVTLSRINARLGSSYSVEQVEKVFDHLGFSYTKEGESYTITAPFERRDITIPEDIAEEVGRVIGYDSIPATPLLATSVEADQARYKGIERVKDFLIERGFSEVSTQSFAVGGHMYLANPLDLTKPALRSNLSDNMQDALTRGATIAPRMLGPATALKLFDVGMVFEKDSEHISLAIGYMPLSGKKQPVIAEITGALREILGDVSFVSSDATAETNLDRIDLAALGAGYDPKPIRLGTFHLYSIYPFALRDIAVWTSAGTEESAVSGIIRQEAGDLLVRMDLFDRFEKEGRISYAFRLVFESMERTLSDEDLNPIMERITTALHTKEGWEVR